MLILASSSPTRAGILRSFDIDFVQKSVDFDEDSIVASSPREFVYTATIGKMGAAKKAFGLEIPILCADTVVSAGAQILRKAKDRDDAKRLLGLQSGSEVSIVTCSAYAREGLNIIDLAVTKYLFAKFENTDMERYLDSGEWEGKAGAIMVEGFAKPYIERVNGYESTAMGLCVERLIHFLK